MKVSKKYLVWTTIVCVLALAINAYIIMHSCLDALESSKASSGVVEVTEEVINTISPGTITPENHDSFTTFIRKAFGHFGLFFDIVISIPHKHMATKKALVKVLDNLA